MGRSPDSVAGPMRGRSRLPQLLQSESGQASLELALVLFAFLGIAVAFGSLWQLLEQGALVEHALASASHHIGSVSAGVIGDVFLY